MDALETAASGEVGEVAPHGLERDVEVAASPLDRDLALAPRDVEDLGVAKRLGHGSRAFAFPVFRTAPVARQGRAARDLERWGRRRSERRPIAL